MLIVSFLTEKAFYFFVVFWAVQIIFAVRTAQLEKSQGEENSLAPKESDEILIPNELSRKEKYLFKIRETLKLQLDIGENLIESLFATLEKYRQYYLGLTNKHLVIIELDFLAKPLDVKKNPLSDLEKVLYNSGLLFEEITFHQTNGKLIKFQIFHQYKEQAKNFLFLNLKERLLNVMKM